MADMRQKRAEEDEAEKENQDEDEEMEDASTSKVKATGKGRKAAVESDDSMAADLNPNAGGGDEMSDEERSERSRSASPAKGAKKGNGKAAAPKAKSPAKKSAAKAKQAPLVSRKNGMDWTRWVFGNDLTSHHYPLFVLVFHSHSLKVNWMTMTLISR